MTFLYHKNGILKMRSEGKIDAPSLDCTELNLTDKQLTDLQNNVPAQIVDGQIEFHPEDRTIPIDIKEIIKTAKDFNDLKNKLLNLQ